MSKSPIGLALGVAAVAVAWNWPSHAQTRATQSPAPEIRGSETLLVARMSSKVQGRGVAAAGAAKTASANSRVARIMAESS